MGHWWLDLRGTCLLLLVEPCFLLWERRISRLASSSRHELLFPPPYIIRYLVTGMGKITVGNIIHFNMAFNWLFYSSPNTLKTFLLGFEEDALWF